MKFQIAKLRGGGGQFLKPDNNKNNNKDNSGDPLIGIIIPFYDVEKYLSKCLDSVVNQTYKNLRIVLINDGSNDKSLEIAKRYFDKDKRIQILNAPNRGTSVARNLGLRFISNLAMPKRVLLDLPDLINPPKSDKMALKNADLIKQNERENNESLEIITHDEELLVPEFIHFVDSDDWLDLDCIQKCVNALKPGVQVVWHNGMDFDEVKCAIARSTVISRLELPFFVTHSGSDIYKAIKRPHFTWVCNGIFSLDLALRNNLFFKENIILEDELFGRKLFAFASSVVLIPDDLYFYRIRKNSNCQYYATKDDAKIYTMPAYKVPLLQYFDPLDVHVYFSSYSFLEICKELDAFLKTQNNLYIKRGLRDVIHNRLNIAYRGFTLKDGDPYALKEQFFALIHHTRNARYIKLHYFLCKIGIVQFKRDFSPTLFTNLGKIKRFLQRILGLRVSPVNYAKE